MNKWCWGIAGFFCVCTPGAFIQELMDSSNSVATTPVIDESAILVHNGQGARFTQAPNSFFQVRGPILVHA